MRLASASTVLAIPHPSTLVEGLLSTVPVAKTAQSPATPH
jgi:hypothetical protein